VHGRLDRLVRVARADKGGRGQAGKKYFPAGGWLIERYRLIGTR